ncbi:Rho-type gtpase-activating protein [Coemansia sp. RSA 1365]|nr:Rho-type gtpase-activating protein [Coemansia sp. RSA 1365]
MSGEIAKPETTATTAAVEGAGVLADGSLLNSPPKCWGCQKPIDGGSAIQFADGVWHIDCFQCTTCSKVIEFDSNLLFLADGKPICPECSYCCSLCKKPIFDEAIVTVEGTYHSECFRCTNCKQRIQGKSFAKTSQGIIYCVGCYAERRERKKAARRRREHQVMEEKMLPQLPAEAANAAAAVNANPNRNPDDQAASRSEILSPTQANPLSASSTVTSVPTMSSATADASSQQSPLLPPHTDDSNSRRATLDRMRRRGVHRPDDMPFSENSDAKTPPENTTQAPTAALSAPTSPTSAREQSASLLPSSPLHAPLAGDPELEAGLAWTEDINALERNFVRFSLRSPLATKGSEPEGDNQDGSLQAGLERRGAQKVSQRGKPSHIRTPALRRAGSVGKSQRSRAASSASVLGSMVPPGLRSSREKPDAKSNVDGRAWLSTATVDQLKGELLVNYGQLCRMEASYQKLRDLYASVIDQLLESRESLQQERAKRTEFETILRSYYGYVPPENDASSKHGRLQQQQQQHQHQSPQQQQRTTVQPASTSTKQPQLPPRNSQGPNSTAQLSRQPSHRRQRQARRQEASGVADHDSGSDAEDAIITTVPQKATKRFIWPFGGGNSGKSHAHHEHNTFNSNSSAATASAGAASAGKSNSEDHSQHSFHPISTFRASKCDYCQERLKSFTNSVVRCRNCGLVCHQRCSGNVPTSCIATDNKNRGAGTQPLAGVTMSGISDNHQSHVMFGRDLVSQAADEGQSVPWIVRAAIAFIEMEGLTMEGVYRRSGSTMDINTVQAEIQRIGTATNGKFDDLSVSIASPDMDVTSVTSVLKQYFRDLPNPLMTESTYHLWVQAANIDPPEERIKIYRTICDSMPTAHAETLRFLMRHLKRISEHQQENKMTTNNLSVVFAPNVLHLAQHNVLQDMANMSEINKTVSFLIQHADTIWSDAIYEKQDPKPNAPASSGAAKAGTFQLPPMKRQTDVNPFDLGPVPGVSPMVLSSPSTPAQYRTYYDYADDSAAANSHAEQMSGFGEGSLSHSMPSPAAQFLNHMQQQQQTYREQRDNAMYSRTSVDIPRDAN